MKLKIVLLSLLISPFAFLSVAYTQTQVFTGTLYNQTFWSRHSTSSTMPFFGAYRGNNVVFKVDHEGNIVLANGLTVDGVDISSFESQVNEKIDDIETALTLKVDKDSPELEAGIWYLAGVPYRVQQDEFGGITLEPTSEGRGITMKEVSIINEGYGEFWTGCAMGAGQFYAGYMSGAGILAAYWVEDDSTGRDLYLYGADAGSAVNLPPMNGGGILIQSGGGANARQGTNDNGGHSGNIVLQPKSGGVSESGVGGSAGLIWLQGGTGGASTSGVGGSGSNICIEGGEGGEGAEGGTGGSVIIKAGDGGSGITEGEPGNVQLYYGNSQKVLETTSSGVSVLGDLSATGTITGQTIFYTYHIYLPTIEYGKEYCPYGLQSQEAVVYGLFHPVDVKLKYINITAYCNDMFSTEKVRVRCYKSLRAGGDAILIYTLYLFIGGEGWTSNNAVPDVNVENTYTFQVVIDTFDGETESVWEQVGVQFIFEPY